MYLLARSRAWRIFTDAIAPQLTGGRTPQKRPVAVLIGGQPGVGKSMAQASVLAALGRPDAVAIDTDELRVHHPDYERLSRADDRAASGIMQSDVQRWAIWSLRHACAAHLDVVLSQTLRDPDHLRRLAARFHRHGYRVEVVFVAGDLARSRLGALTRYLSERSRTGFGRYVPPTYQSAAYHGLATSVMAVDQEPFVDRVHVFRRGGICLHSNHMASRQTWGHPPQAYGQMVNERLRPWSPAERQDFDQQMESVSAEAADWVRREADAIRAAAAPLRRGRHRRLAAGSPLLASYHPG